MKFLWNAELEKQVRHAAIDANMDIEEFISHTLRQSVEKDRPTSPPPAPVLPVNKRAAVQMSIPGMLAAPKRALKLPSLPRAASWLLRLLWALEYARLHNRGPLISAQLTRILKKNGKQRVFTENTSRKFRELQRAGAYQDCWRMLDRKRFAITPTGQSTLYALLQVDNVVSTAANDVSSRQGVAEAS